MSTNALVDEKNLHTRVLVVEDDPHMARFISFKLDYLGYKVVGHARNEAQAIELAKDLEPDLILMDILLDDDDDGIEVAKKILGFTDIPIVYLTAQEDDELFERAKITQPFGYLLKPFNDRDLNLVIETATYRQNLKQALAQELDEARSIIDSTLYMIITFDLRDRISVFNQTAQWVLGYANDDVKGRPINDLLVDPDDLKRVKSSVARNQRDTLEIEFLQQDGKTMLIPISAGMLRNPDGNPSGILMISH